MHLVENYVIKIKWKQEGKTSNSYRSNKVHQEKKICVRVVKTVSKLYIGVFRVGK